MPFPSVAPRPVARSECSRVQPCGPRGRRVAPTERRAREGAAPSRRPRSARSNPRGPQARAGPGRPRRRGENAIAGKRAWPAPPFMRSHGDPRRSRGPRLRHECAHQHGVRVSKRSAQDARGASETRAACDFTARCRGDQPRPAAQASRSGEQRGGSRCWIRIEPWSRDVVIEESRTRGIRDLERWRMRLGDSASGVASGGLG